MITPKISGMLLISLIILMNFINNAAAQERVVETRDGKLLWGELWQEFEATETADCRTTEQTF